MVRKRRDLQQDIDGGEKRNKKDGKPGNQLDGGKRARGRELESAQHQVSDDIHDGCGDDLVEGILDEAAEPAPEKPLHFRNDKKGNEDGAYQDANRGGDESIGDDHNRYRLGCGEQNGDDDVDGGSEKISPARRVHASFEARNLRDYGLELRLIDLRREKLGFVGDEVVEAYSDAGDGGAVVIDHREAKADGQKQARKMIELEGRPAAGGCERGLDSKPSHENRGERTEKILAHGVEEAEVLGEQIVDRLKDVLEEIGLHCRQLLRRRASLGARLRHAEVFE